MASKPCISCLRALKRQLIPNSQKSILLPISHPTGRAFTNTSLNFVAASSSAPSPAAPNPKSAKDANKTPLSAKAVAEFKRVTGRLTDTYVVFGVTEKLFKECSRQADYSIAELEDSDAEIPKTADGEDLGEGDGWWHTELGLKPTFSTWSQVTMLHMYLLSARIRDFPAEYAPEWQQHLLDHFFYAAEERMMVYHNLQMRGARQRYLKDLFTQWRGLLLAYDEGVMKGDAVLAAAVWRNVFKGDENVDARNLALIVSYIRMALAGLDRMSNDELASGVIEFGNPGTEKSLVQTRSKMMDMPFMEGEKSA